MVSNTGSAEGAPKGVSWDPALGNKGLESSQNPVVKATDPKCKNAELRETKAGGTTLAGAVNHLGNSRPSKNIPSPGSEQTIDKGRLARLKDRILGRSTSKKPENEGRVSSLSQTTMSKADVKSAAKAEAANTKALEQQTKKYNLALEYGRIYLKQQNAFFAMRKLSTGGNEPKIDLDKDLNQTQENAEAEKLLQRQNMPLDKYLYQTQIDECASELKKIEKQIRKLFGPGGLSDEVKDLAVKSAKEEINVKDKNLYKENSEPTVNLELRSAHQQQLAEHQRKLMEALNESGKSAPTPEQMRQADAATVRFSTRELEIRSKLSVSVANLVSLTKASKGLKGQETNKEKISGDLALAQQEVSEFAKELYEECGKDKARFAKLSPDIKPDGNLTNAKLAEIQNEVKTQAKRR